MLLKTHIHTHALWHTHTHSVTHPRWNPTSDGCKQQQKGTSSAWKIKYCCPLVEDCMKTQTNADQRNNGALELLLKQQSSANLGHSRRDDSSPSFLLSSVRTSCKKPIFCRLGPIYPVWCVKFRSKISDVPTLKMQNSLYLRKKWVAKVKKMRLFFGLYTYYLSLF